MRLLNTFFFWCVMAALCDAAQFVAVLETMKEPQAKLEGAELRYLTDELRKQALQALPIAAGYTVMTRENIQAMLPPGKKIEECQGECLVETGRNIGADFVAQGRVGKFGGQLTLTVELYETRASRLVGSFTGRKPSAEGLLDLVGAESAGLFAKVRAGQKRPVSDAAQATGVQLSGGNGDFELDAAEMFLVEVRTQPTGAAVSVDGRPSCPQTPCKVQLEKGEHRFLAVLESYSDAEATVIIQKAGQKVTLSMDANFGILDLRPRLAAAQASELALTVDGKSVSAGEMRLSPGRHEVVAGHRCLEDVQATVGLAKGGRETFAPDMTPKLAGLALSAEKAGEPQAAPVWIEGTQVGITPWSGKVPVCAQVQVGERREPVPVTLEYKKTVRYTHKMATTSAGMVAIPAGCFNMGSTENDDEKPVHRVCVSAFSMDQTEVTQGTYKAQTGQNPSSFRSCGDDCPVEQVDWSQAKSYCESQGKRLPTEAEWEYAARAGTNSKWYWGNSESNAGSYAWFASNSGYETHPVGQKQPNAWGLYDMAGNVWEWTSDWYAEDYYSSSPSQDPQGVSSGSNRVLRGGCWGNFPAGLRSANRDYNAPGYRLVFLGFRCVAP